MYEVANIGDSSSIFCCVLWYRPFLWGEAGRRVEGERAKVGWLQWVAPGSSEVLDSLDTGVMKQSLEHFPQHAQLEVHIHNP